MQFSNLISTTTCLESHGSHKQQIYNLLIRTASKQKLTPRQLGS